MSQKIKHLKHENYKFHEWAVQKKYIYIYFKLFGVGYFTQAGKIKNGSLKFSGKILF